MSSLKTLFGPSKDELWKQLSEEIGGQFVDGGFRKGNKVVAKASHWTVTLDTYTVSTGKTHVTYTRLRAPFCNPDGFRFTIYQKSVFSGLGKLLGMQDIEIGYPDFDDSFIIQGNNESKLRSLFADSRLRQLIQDQPKIHLQVKDDEGWFGAEFPEGVDELCFQVVGVIKDIALLKALFELFSVALDDLCRMGPAYTNDPNVTL
jgi:hypothetical protein